MVSNKSTLKHYLLAILFIQMTVLPANHPEFKIPFLAIILLCSLIIISISVKRTISTWVLSWFFFFISYGIFWGGYGLILAKPDALGFLRLQVLWPFIYMLLLPIISGEDVFKKIDKVFFFTALLISIYSINFILSAMGMPSLEFMVGWDEEEAFGLHDGFLMLNNQNIGSLVFIAPYLISSIMANGQLSTQKTRLTIATLTVAIVILSSRRMINIACVIAPIIHFIIFNYLEKAFDFAKLAKVIMAIISIILVFLLFYYVFNLDGAEFFERITFSGSQGEGVSYRIGVTNSLLNEVFNYNIWLGTGGGSKPFEIHYVRVLHESGLIGLIIYLSLLATIFSKIAGILKKQVKSRGIGIPILVGYTCFLLGELTNPYFGSFDYMWMLFLPVAFINFYTLNTFRVLAK